MSKTIKELRAEIKELKQSLDAECDLSFSYKQQRDFHRKFIVSELRLQADCESSTYWAPKTIIERIAKHMAASQNWYW